MKLGRKTVLPLLLFLFVILFSILIWRSIEPFAILTSEYPVRVASVPHNHEIPRAALPNGSIQAIQFQLWKNNRWNTLSSTEHRNIDQPTKVNFVLEGVQSKNRLRTSTTRNLTAVEQGLPFNTNLMTATGKLTIRNLDQLVQDRTSPGDPALNGANLKVLITFDDGK